MKKDKYRYIIFYSIPDGNSTQSYLEIKKNRYDAIRFADDNNGIVFRTDYYYQGENDKE